MAHISVVIPVYKAEEHLHELYRRLKQSLEIISKDFEIILVEDCGGDRSWDIIMELAERDIRVRGIQFSRNFGQHYGITAGLDYCRGDWVVIMDCDLQDRPEEIPRLYAKAQEGFDIVLAKRARRKDKFLKRFTSRLFYRLFSYFADIEYDEQVGNFRIMASKVVQNLRLIRESLRFLGGLVNWVGFSTSSIEAQHEERSRGKSTYTIKKLFKLASEVIIAYSDKPLRISIFFGFIVSMFSFLYGTYIIFKRMLYGIPVLGWSTLAVSFFFINGIIIINLGIIGIYLGKTFDETKKRPLYIINKFTPNANV